MNVVDPSRRRDLCPVRPPCAFLPAPAVPRPACAAHASCRGNDRRRRSFLFHGDETGQMRQPHLPYLPPPGSSECPEQSGSAAAIVSPAGGMRSTGRVLGQQARDKTREAGQGTGHGGGRGQRPALFEKDRYAGSLPDFAFDVQPPVVQRGYLAA